MSKVLYGDLFYDIIRADCIMEGEKDSGFETRKDGSDLSETRDENDYGKALFGGGNRDEGLCQKVRIR